MVPKSFFDAVEAIKHDLRIDKRLASTIASLDKAARLRAAENGADFQTELEKAVSDTGNPEMIKRLWEKYRPQ